MNQKLFESISRTRVITQKDAIEVIGVTMEELESYQQQKILSLKSIEVKKEVVKYYELSERGEKIVKENFDTIGQFYRGFDVLQDLTLSQFYLKLSEDVRATWETKDDLIVEYRLTGTVDGVFQENGKWRGVKVLNTSANSQTAERYMKFVEETKLDDVMFLMYQSN